MNLKQKNYDRIEKEIYKSILDNFERDSDSNADFALNELLADKDIRLRKVYEFVFEKSNLSDEFGVLLIERSEYRKDIEDRQYKFDNR